MRAGEDANKCQKGLPWNFNHLTSGWSLTSHQVVEKKYFKTDQTLATQPNSLQKIRIVSQSTKIYTSSKYFHSVGLVCFGVKQKYIIDSASTVKQLEIHIDMKKLEREGKIIECKNLYFHSITRSTEKKSTSYTASAETEESWKLITFLLHTPPEFQITFAFNSARRRAFFPLSCRVC